MKKKIIITISSICLVLCALFIFLFCINKKETKSKVYYFGTIDNNIYVLESKDLNYTEDDLKQENIINLNVKILSVENKEKSNIFDDNNQLITLDFKSEIELSGVKTTETTIHPQTIHCKTANIKK